MSHMHFNDEELPASHETGSDELLSDDNLRLPESANPLVRLHAVRAWLTRRQRETEQDIGQTALILQQTQEAKDDGTRMRRRELEAHQARIQLLQHTMQETQQRLDTYDEARSLLEECVDHTTIGERLLVEYYLLLEDLIQTALQTGIPEDAPRIQAFTDVLNRIERVGIAVEED